METQMPNPSQRKPSIFPMFILALVLIALFYLLAKWLVATTPRSADEDAVRGQERVAILEKVQSAQKQRLEGYKWADEKKGLVQIPIEKAMELAIGKLNAKRPEKAAAPIPPQGSTDKALASPGNVQIVYQTPFKKP